MLKPHDSHSCDYQYDSPISDPNTDKKIKQRKLEEELEKFQCSDKTPRSPVSNNLVQPPTSEHSELPPKSPEQVSETVTSEEEQIDLSKTPEKNEQTNINKILGKPSDSVGNTNESTHINLTSPIATPPISSGLFSSNSESGQPGSSIPDSDTQDNLNRTRPSQNTRNSKKITGSIFDIAKNSERALALSKEIRSNQFSITGQVKSSTGAISKTQGKTVDKTLLGNGNSKTTNVTMSTNDSNDLLDLVVVTADE